MGIYQRLLQPRLLDLAMDTSSAREIRSRVCAGLSGDVLEIGYGSGHNQAHLPAAVHSVAAVEPSAVAWRLSGVRRAASKVPVRLVGDDAQHLDLPDDHFDAALSTWTLCAVPDPVAALGEIRRVVKPGGTLHFVEHGLAPDPGVVRWQRRGNAINHWLAGCVLDRDVRELFPAAGLGLEAFTSYYEDGSPKAAGYFSEGRAVA
jgi:ubiquinone/menaquinone biosynthesis C-methylase UbiE